MPSLKGDVFSLVRQGRRTPGGRLSVVMRQVLLSRKLYTLLNMPSYMSLINILMDDIPVNRYKAQH
jgi:hypothetical protein